MSDLNKLFESAPEGAVEIVTDASTKVLRWASKSHMWNFANDSWMFRNERWKTIATRPQPERKTVEDAVAAVVTGFDGDGLWYSPRRKQWIASPEYMASDSYLVCTREEFEACVAAKNAKSEPEWTHTYDDYGTEKDCIVVHNKPDDYGFILVMNRRGEYVLSDDVKEKPTKPAITKAEAWDKLNDGGFYNAQYGLDQIRHDYNITN